MNSVNAPPLPPGWTEHVGPAGQPYYYHAGTRESTYVRPLPAFPIIPQAIIPQPPKKKDKPLVKIPIPGTEWLRVTTTEGNIFYSHKAKKQSVWTMPEEIKDAVEAFERAEEHVEAQKQQQEAKEKDIQKLGFEEEQELKRIKTEMQGLVKRKAEEPQPLDEVVISKKARVEEEEEEGEGEGEDDDDDDDDDGSEEGEEEWQREAAAQLAAEAEEETKKLEEEARLAQEAEDTEAKKMQENERSQLNMPDRVDLSIEEAKALFKTLLREKNISPLHPWDTSLPLFISDPRYVLLPSVSARRDAFDEYCRDRARELRQQNVKKEKAEANPKEEYERLLSQEVKSTRTSWSDFRRTWKKDRRFYGWGRDDREREKRFKEYLKELGERKRIAAEKAEADFFTLLRESGVVRSDSLWKDVKRRLSHDARYDAVGSSSLREELFQTFLKAHGSSSSHSASTKIKDEACKHATEEDAEQRRRHKKEQALKEREQKVKADRSRMDAEIGRSKMGLNLEEGEREFRTLLTDAVRDPQTNWELIRPQLQTDPRFNNSPLSVNQQLNLFHAHMSQLQMKHLTGLHSLFQAHAPSLATPFSALPLESMLKSLPVTKLAFDTSGLQQEYEKWQRERTYECRKAFDEMLAENSFVEFWGRLGKIGGEGVEGGVKADDLGEDEGEGFGGKVDMKALAKSVDLSDIEKVLKNDKRYIMFEHVAAQRERWLRDYVVGLTAPKLSVHV